MIIKLRFAEVGAGASAANGSSPNGASPGAESHHPDKDVFNVSVFRPSNEEPTIRKMGNVIESGIRKTSEFYPEAA